MGTDTLELVHDEVNGRLERRSDGLKQIDTKASILLGFAAAAIRFSATHRVLTVLHGVVIAFYAVALAAGGLAIAVRTWKEVPNLDVMTVKFKGLTRDEALGRLIRAKAKALRDNNLGRDIKVWAWYTGLAFLAAGVVLVVLREIQG